MVRVFASFVAVVVAVSISGCAASEPQGFLKNETGGGDPMVVSDGRVALSVLPYAPEMEAEVLGADLHLANQLAIEVAIENIVGEEGRVFVFRRHYALAVFQDGTRRYPIDPMKVYEKNRINQMAAVFWFGASGALIAESADRDRRTGFAAASSNELRLADDTPRATGFLYFDTEGVSGRGLAELIVEYEECGVDELWRINVDLGEFEFKAPDPEPDEFDGPRHVPNRRRRNPFPS